MGWLIRGGRVLRPDGSLEELDLRIALERVIEIGVNLPVADSQVIDARDLIVLPGLVDPHVHLREPGQTEKETIETGTMAAAAGGFAHVCCMPNTSPVVDAKEIVETIIEKADSYGYAKVHPIAAITHGLRGETLTDFAALVAAGAVGFSDDGKGVQRADIMRQALLAAKDLDVPIVVHAEDETLSRDGHLHDGDVARELSIKGIPSEAEAVMIARDIVLCEATGGAVHFCHVSPKSAVRVIRDAIRAGISVTAEVTPHHLLLTEKEALRVGAWGKVNPPLRHESDRAACVEGLIDGTLSMVATDHAPHTAEEKARPIETSPFGFVGLEISFPLMYTTFVHSGLMSLGRLVDCMARIPAERFKIDAGTIEVGGFADLTLIDPHTFMRVDPETFLSKGRATPFAGRNLTGWPTLTIHRGRMVFTRTAREESNE
ncbi:dihydroorotase [Ferroacidibacillus organovorans]|uniref:Dihydroorotase n=1 Tax=Ferroacidibacillus organovorans TaxID=1765683 RepID=A0A101XQA0_9BACL|nr:dihydroorotase [Ferroacidibacillus organovorans]KUO95578.1 hypothetical protein ATW55_06785 [Ferroacidibacillus organovorans]